MADNPRLWIFDEKKEDIDAYIERWEARFRRKELTSDSKKIDWFIEDCGQAMHNALRTLSRPLQVKDLRWDQITATLVQHWGPRRNKHLERRKFRARVRQAGESFNDFALALRDLSQFCDFQDLNESLIEAFLNGLGDQEVLKHLVSQDFETFNEYVAESYNRQASMRVVDTNNTTVNAVASTSKKKSGKKNKSGTGNTANNVTFHTAGKQTPKPSPQPNQKPQPTQKPPATPKPSAATPGKQPDNVCFGCGQLHFRSNCPYKNATCFGCHQVGHVKSVCGKFRNNTNLVSGNFQTPPLKDMPNDGFGFGDNFGGLCHISVANLSPPIPEAGKKVFVDVQVNHQPITAQLDCGAIVTICGEPLYQARWADSPLRNPLLDLQGPPANNIDVKGVIDVTVKCAEGDLTLPLYVAKGHFPFLLGNNWIPFLELDYNKLLKKSKHPEICALQRTELEELAQQFPYCFGKVAGPIEGYEARVRLKDNAIPKFIPHREPPIPLRQPTEKELKRMEEAQFLRPVLYSKWASPTVIVPKKNGQEVRICGDYSATVNPQVETAYYPIPKIDHLSMVSGKYFTKLDMKDAYCHVKIAEEDQEILTLSTHVGLKAVMRLLFGLSFAPAEFMSIISQILGELLNEYYDQMFLYLDDLLLAAKTKEALQDLMKKVLTLLNKHKVQINVAKCVFIEEQVDFLGLRLSARGLQPDPMKVQKIHQSQIPKDRDQLLCFLGMVNFYNKFIKNMSTTAAPLYALRDTTFKWGDAQHKAAMSLINSLNSEVLVPYSLHQTLRLTCDASPIGAGAVLAHVSDTGEERPIAYASKSFTTAEQGYSQIEREAAAVIFAFKKFQHYLYGRHFELVTDNTGLMSLLNPKHQRTAVAVGRIQRWYLLISSYNFTLKHKRSQEIPHADCLSRIPGEENTPIENEDNTIYFVDYLPITASEIREQTTKDPVLSRVVSYVQFGWPDTPVDPVFEAYKRKGIELTLEVGCLLWGSRVVIPTVLREQVKYLLHSEHLGESKIKMLARSHVYWPDIDKDIEDFVKKCSVCRVLDVQKKPMPVIPWTWSTAPWKRIFVDFAKKDGVTFMITVDHHSKYPFVEIMQSTTATAVIGYLKILFAQFGFPCELVADNGPPFDAAAFKEFLKNHHTTLKHSPVGHPQSNGEAEKMVQTFKKTLLKQLLDPETAHRTLQDQVSSFLYSYRNTPHVLTKCPPSELFLKRQMRTHFTVLNPLTNLNEKVQNRLNDTAQKRGGKFKEFNAGDTVWVRVMIDNNKFIYKPAVIQRRVSSDSYDIMLNGRVRHTSAEHMYYRDPNADPIDLLDLPRLTQEPEQIEIPVPVPVQKKTANDSPASIPRVEKILQSPQQTPIPVANSTPKGIEQELSIPKSPSMGQPPQTPARASTPSQPSGRRLFNTPPSPTHRPKRNAGRPRYLQDYV
ncbi:uncharacterized protein K02A2.6-like [Frankliniella occidentalis]|uniref:RNA-directed DNA polymerase n=1 Tax=Frankliniella occidentalis TaxID=133901 RepID=A0A6J1T6V3_FRAOC|nr:uncharacterized protein K02A2.6-like [Frankliniella occidentalis]